jgi:uncharacterized membrane protein YphA (DoxX/SURF4 family)
MNKIHLGRNVYALAAIFYGALLFVWRDLNAWKQSIPLDRVPHPQIFLYIAGAVEVLGGLAVLWPPGKRIGAFALGGIYLILALLAVPDIIAGGWVDFFEQLSLVAAALIVLAANCPDRHERARKLAQIGYVLFGVCVISFTAAQVVFLSITVKLVPKWMPPGQMFWAIVTTIAFALAAVALLSGRSALLASQLLTIMLVGFGILVWLPIVFSAPHVLFNWTENAENLAIAGAAWIVADYLAEKQAGTP